MPLSDELTPAAVHGNIKELVGSGYPQRQAVAIALSHVRELKKKRRKGRK